MVRPARLIAVCLATRLCGSLLVDGADPPPPSSTQPRPAAAKGRTFSFRLDDSRVYPGTHREIAVYVPAVDRVLEFAGYEHAHSWGTGGHSWSADGLTFGPPARLAGPVKSRCHNVGLSGTPDGHLLPDGRNFIAYAYGDGSRPDPSRAFWYTYLNPIDVRR